MKTNVARLLTGAFALALLLAVGLSANNSAQAQSVGPAFVCSTDSAGCTIVKFGDADGDTTTPDVYYTGMAGSGTAATPGVTGGVASHDNVFSFSHSAPGKLVIHNLDLPRVTQNVLTAADATTSVDGPDANPKTIETVAANTPIIVVAVHRSSGLSDARCVDADSDGVLGAGECNGAGTTYQVKAFNGNRIQVSFTPAAANTFATIKTVTVDDGRPNLVTISPEPDLIVKGNTDITFSADITDGISGFDSRFKSDNAAENNGIDDNLSPAGPLDGTDGADTENDFTKEGGVRLVVAGNVVSLGESDFTKIDGGWRVSKTINSTAIQTINANVPWYFEVRDRANNVRRTSGAVSGTAGDTSADGTIVDGRFAGNLPPTAFLGSQFRVSRKHGGTTVVSNAQPLGGTTPFAFGSGTFAITNTEADPLFKDAVPTRQDRADPPVDIPSTTGFQCPFDPRDTITFDDTTGTPTATPLPADDAVDATASEQITACNPKAGDSYEILGTNLITIDSEAPRLQGSDVSTGIVWRSAQRERGFGLQGRANSIELRFADDGRTEGDNAGSGLDPDSVTPSAFTVGGNTVTSVVVASNDVYLTLESNLAPDERPSVSVANGMIMDKAGNAYGGTRVGKAVDRLGPNLTLSEDSDLSNEKVTVTITADEQLGANPDVTLSRVIDGDGATAGPDAQVCNASETPDKNELAAVPDAGCAELNVAASAGPPAVEARTYVVEDDPRRPSTQPSVGQATALTFSYAANANAVNPSGETGGKYNVYVTGRDTHDEENMGKAGHASDANNSAAFTFQLDTVLNGGVDPIVSVSDNKNVAMDDSGVEQISPMIITVDWKGESGEYPGDSYRTVEMTSAVLKVTFADGSSETTTFDLATEVSSQDSTKYTIPLLNPKVGAYSLTVKGKDSAGNVRIDGTGTTEQSLSANWTVTAPKPVEIDLKPGWNLISLPFQPANPAINSIIPADHPASLVMSFDNDQQVWLFSRRDAETGMFTGEVGALTATTAYFVNTNSFEPLELFRSPLGTGTAAPARIPALELTEGWNLVPVITNETPVPDGIDADTYFGTLGDTWLRALAWDPLARSWTRVSRGQVDHTFGMEATGDDFTDRCDRTHKYKPSTATVSSTVKGQVCVGEGLWLYVTEDGTLIPG